MNYTWYIIKGGAAGRDIRSYCTLGRDLRRTSEDLRLLLLLLLGRYCLKS